MLTIGPLKIAMPAVQAALSGFSDRPMRVVARRFGAEFASAEVMLDELVIREGKHRLRLLKIGSDDHPLGGQLLGSRPEQFAQAASELVEAGYDVVDINLGCPVRKVLGRCSGGFLLSEPESALAIVKAVIQAVGGRRPVTVKMRRGFDDSSESERNFFSILDGALGLGAAAITVHGRTVKQRYIGPSSWGFLARVKRHAGPATILGSGDLFTAQAVVQMMNETGVDGVTVARGAIGNPFIFRECRALLQESRELPPPPVSEQREALELHMAESLKLYDDARVSAIVRKFGISYAGLHPMPDDVRTAFIGARKLDEVRAVLTSWYDPLREWPKVERREMPRDLIAAGAEA